jgi:RNA polymerase primary sigma factor
MATSEGLDGLRSGGRCQGACPDQARLLAEAGEGPDGRERLIAAYLPRIRAIARRYRFAGLEVEELTQEGVLALLEALARFDRGRAVAFWAYARPWVHGAIHRLAVDWRRAMRLPPAASIELSQLRDTRQRLAREWTAEPPLQEVAREAHLGRERAELLLMAGRTARSLQEPLGESDGPTLGDLVPDPDAEGAYEDVCTQVESPELGPLLEALSARERDVIARRFGLDRPPETLAAIGRRLGVTRERARQIEAHALRKLQEAAA